MRRFLRDLFVYLLEFLFFYNDEFKKYFLIVVFEIVYFDVEILKIMYMLKRSVFIIG